jgi:osmotically inducible protein OsmC
MQVARRERIMMRTTASRAKGEFSEMSRNLRCAKSRHFLLSDGVRRAAVRNPCRLDFNHRRTAGAPRIPFRYDERDDVVTSSRQRHRARCVRLVGAAKGSSQAGSAGHRNPIFWRTLVQKTASAKWSGGIKDGKGAISTKSGALTSYPYGFASRFEGKPGTNPEELIGAAHAGCFTMALSLILSEAKLTAEKMETQADVTLAKQDDGFAITAVHLTLKAKIPGVDDKTFQELAAKAKAGCPVSKVLNAKITLDAKLES